MVVKDNQPTLKADLETLFTRPPGPGQDLRHAQSVNKGHGRLETRHLAVSADLKDYLDWPGFQQALCLDYRSVQTKSGEVLTSRRLAITSLSSQQADPDTCFVSGVPIGRLRTTCTIYLMSGFRKMPPASIAVRLLWRWPC